MKIFVTGATGFVGSVVVEELQRRNHNVIGLARSERSTHALQEQGVEVHRGDISRPESIVPVLNQVDAVIHTAFNHDFSQYAENCQSDGRLLDAMASALEGTNKPLIAASTTVVTGKEDPSTEHDPAINPIPRSASEAFLSFADKGVQTGVVRLPPTVHGMGDTAFVPMLIALAQERGLSAYIDEGTNLWSAVHRRDAARLFCDVVQQARPSARYHAIAESGVPFREIAEAIGHGLDVPVESVPGNQAEEHFGWLAMFAASNVPASSEWTQRTTGWRPHEASLISDIHNAGYFERPDH